MSTVVKVLQYIGNISALLYFSTPLIQVFKQKLYKNVDNIKDISLVLIIAILINCLFWLLNAISSGNLKEWIPLLISNIGGLAINIALLFWYLYVLLDHNKKQFLGYGFFVINVLLQIGYLIYRFVIKDKGENSFHLIGYVATVINIFMYSSPYFNYKKVINSKKSDAIPIFTIASGLITCLIFFIQGFVSFINLKNVKENRRDRQSNIETMLSNAISFILLTILAALYSFPPPSCIKNENTIKENYKKINKEKDEVLNMNINEGIN
jgi:uncharacterized protein with PQ loop repeat